MSFLAEVMEAKRAEVVRLRATTVVAPSGPRPGFRAALSADGMSVIAEIKRRSPSKGAIAPSLDAVALARAYADGGASAISCLTDRTFFGARSEDFSHARTAGLPVLRKDFLIDETQIDESLSLGASAVLLIVRILDQAQLAVLLHAASERGLDALVEVHSEAEVERALKAGASIIGINNRDLDTLVVDHDLALRLRAWIPRGVLAVAESGVKTRADVVRFEDAGFDAVLIGETLASHSDPAAKLRELMGGPSAETIR